MKEFLEVIADGYLSGYPDISRFCFIMPNKRSGSFLLKHIGRLSRKAVIAPRIISITDFVGDIASEVVDSRLDLLFRLYECYRNLPGSIPDLSFENFSSWGETILSDFNEIDMQCADASAIFKNIDDLNAIRSNYLSDSQKAVMVEYFGYSPELFKKDDSSLWNNFEKAYKAGKSNENDAKQRFVSLWQLLYPLYRNFKKSLKESGLTTSGGAYRTAADKLENGYEPYPGEKIVVVGFNALTESEKRIFKVLQTQTVDIGLGPETKVDFIWDKVSPLLAGNDEPAAKFIGINSRKENFPSPAWIDKLLEKNNEDTGVSQEIEVIAVPSNVMQVKVAGEELEKIADTLGHHIIEDAKVAVILPDENLLLPLLYSLPDSYKNPNLTMGFPLRHTPVISYAYLLRKLHSRSRQTKGETYFFFEDVKDILGHPYSRILFESSKIKLFIDDCERKKRLIVTAAETERLGEKWQILFVYLDDMKSPRDVIRYIYEILTEVKRGLDSEKGSYRRGKIEKTYIDTYIDALVRLDNCMLEFSPVISPSGLFRLADRLIAGETVSFEGEPLQGLQVMGVLETRCLDFNRIIMLSVNEKIMPRVGRNSTFLSNAVRSAFGLPPANYQEEIFAYYFFRLLGRCSHALLTYDSRTSEIRNPGVSRYVQQMKYLPGLIKLKEKEARFGMPSSQRKRVSVDKDSEIGLLIRQYLAETSECQAQPKKFSASALGHYFECNLKFLFNDVLGLYMEREKSETIDAIDLGTIVHNVIENLYMPDSDKKHALLETPVVITKDYLTSLLNKKDKDGELLLLKETKKVISKVHFGGGSGMSGEEISGSAAVIVNYIADYVRNIIRHDLTIAPFRIWGCEIIEVLQYPLPDGRKVSMKMVIDRLDQLGESGEDGQFRIIDYKTGKVHLESDSLADVFGGERKSSNIFQLILYAELFLLMIKNNTLKKEKGDSIWSSASTYERLKENLRLAIYDVPGLPGIKDGSYPKIAGKVIKNIGMLRELEQQQGETFLELLNSKLEEILSETVPFAAEPSEDLCRYCNYRLHCETFCNSRK